MTIAIRQEKPIKEIQMEMEEVKVFLFVDDLSLYIKSPKDSTRKLTNAFSGEVGYKVNTKKSVPEK